MENIVSDASPLIALSAIGKVELLAEMFKVVLVPSAVEKEILAGDRSSPRNISMMQALQTKWVAIVPPLTNPMVHVLRERLGAGESEAIVLARERKLPILIDDLQGRKLASELNLDVTGTLGVLMRAKRYGIIQEVKPLIRLLISEGIYLPPNTKIHWLLREMGEA